MPADSTVASGWLREERARGCAASRAKAASRVLAQRCHRHQAAQPQRARCLDLRARSASAAGSAPARCVGARADRG